MSDFIRHTQDGQVKIKFQVDNFGKLRYRREIHIDPELIALARQKYEESKSLPAGEALGSVAMIPPELAADWDAEGFDVTQETPKSIASRLRAEGLEYLITNAKI